MTERLTDGLSAVIADLQRNHERSEIRTSRHVLRQRELLDALEKQESLLSELQSKLERKQQLLTRFCNQQRELLDELAEMDD